MSQPVMLDPLRTTPTGAAPAVLGAFQDELAAESAGRLRVAAMVMLGLWTLGLVVNHFVVPFLGLRPEQMVPWPPIADVLALACIVLSVAVYYVAPRAALRPARLAAIAMAYEVAIAFAIGVINQWEPRPVAGQLSWVCVIILVFPLLVPGSPGVVLTASLLAASMDPLGLLIARARGLELPGPLLLAWTYIPNYICAVLAVLPSKIIAHLHRKVSRARQLGSYRLVERIGRGGMGEVWKAEHRLFARPAAIKLIAAQGMLEPGGRVAEERFRREAQVAAGLRSPHTIQLYDFGITRDQRLYYVMELLDGCDLDTLVAHYGPQPPARAAHILRQACRSLAEAHATGMVHRDIKPANLHLGRVGLEYDFVKVLDFGLVKRQAGLPAADVELTAPESISGTPAYMAPEMASGEAVDHRADLYALGCVGYFLLTGTRPFEGEHPMQVILQHIRTQPVTPSARLGRPVAPALERLLMRCLAKSPADRPQDAATLGDDLGPAGADDWTQRDARRWWETTFTPAPHERRTEPRTTLLEVVSARADTS
jgi:eukaryotic-like serine/threonine-protein kinase